MCGGGRMWKYSMEVHGGDAASTYICAFVTSPDEVKVKLKLKHILQKVKDCLIASLQRCPLWPRK